MCYLVLNLGEIYSVEIGARSAYISLLETNIGVKTLGYAYINKLVVI